MRISKNKEQIIKILKNSNKSLNVHEIFDIINKMEKINLSTVYRCINSLCNENIISKEIRNDKKSYYTLNLENHKHHLICDMCKKEIVLDFCPINQISQKIKDKIGFDIKMHSIQISGICKKCNKNKK